MKADDLIERLLEETPLDDSAVHSAGRLPEIFKTGEAQVQTAEKSAPAQ